MKDMKGPRLPPWLHLPLQFFMSFKFFMPSSSALEDTEPSHGGSQPREPRRFTSSAGRAFVRSSSGRLDTASSSVPSELRRALDSLPVSSGP